MMTTDKKWDLLKDFSKIFPSKKFEGNVDEIDKDKLEGFMDGAKVFMVIPKRYSIKKIIVDNFDLDNTHKIPVLDYNFTYLQKIDEEKKRVIYRLQEVDEIAVENVSKFSSEFLKVILKLCSRADTIKFKMLKDYPLWIETDELICILAPKVDN